VLSLPWRAETSNSRSRRKTSVLRPMISARTARIDDNLGRGTDGSNPLPSSEESAANPESLDQAVLISGGPQVKRRRVPAPGPDRPHVIASDDRQQRPKTSKANYESSQGETPVNRQIRVGLAMVAAAALGAAAVQMPRPSRPPTTSRRSQPRSRTDIIRNISRSLRKRLANPAGNARRERPPTRLPFASSIHEPGEAAHKSKV
jgi:hypothetical protein